MRRTTDPHRAPRRAALLCAAATVAACATPDDPTVAPPAPFAEPPALTDTNPDPAIVEVQLVAGLSTVEYIPGRPTRVWAYRDGALPGSVGTVPGPMLRAKLGDEIIVHFRNELPVQTTVHWHGPRIPHAADGSHTSQHALGRGETFVYRFVARDAGTFWYHPHVDAYRQIERGLHGPLVIDGGVTPEVSADRTLVLDDVALGADGALVDQLSDDERRFGRQSDWLLVNGRAAPVELRVPAGGRERWRIVNAANGRYFDLRIPGLRFLVIGSDGGLLPEPYRADSLLVVPGERYEVLVEFDGPPGTRMGLETVDYDRGQAAPLAGPRTLVQLVHGARAAPPGPLPSAWRELPRIELTPETPVRRFTLGETGLPGGALFFTINGDFWPGNQPIEVRRGEVEIWEIDNGAAMDHPMHLHGMFFEVLSSHAGSRPRPDGWKDTVNVRRSSTVRLAVRFDPPGVWMLHCHILEHASAGMMIDLIVRE